MDDLNKLLLFKEAHALVQKTYKKKFSGKLGNIKEVSSQLVSGTNYKIVYQTNCGGKVYYVVYTQPWTKTVKIT